MHVLQKDEKTNYGTRKNQIIYQDPNAEESQIN